MNYIFLKNINVLQTMQICALNDIFDFSSTWKHFYNYIAYDNCIVCRSNSKQLIDRRFD